MIDWPIETRIRRLFEIASRITFLTGAGVSAESGIPTFRGPEGYWRIGSVNYQPQEIATFAMFQKMPHEVWKWYLYRRGVCRTAAPNGGHLALAKLEEILGERFHLVTQNVDGLHLRAGNSLSKTFQIHGNINYMRCSAACTTDVFPIPGKTPVISRDDSPSEWVWQQLKCPHCGERTRPHVLLWDETYNEAYYHLQSTLALSQQTDLLIIIGTEGAANLPNRMARQVAASGGAIIDINIRRNLFSDMALTTPRGFFWECAGSDALSKIVGLLET